VVWTANSITPVPYAVHFSYRLAVKDGSRKATRGQVNNAQSAWNVKCTVVRVAAGAATQ